MGEQVSLTQTYQRLFVSTEITWPKHDECLISTMHLQSYVSLHTFVLSKTVTVHFSGYKYDTPHKKERFNADVSLILQGITRLKSALNWVSFFFK